MPLLVWMRFAPSSLLLNTYVNGMAVADFYGSAEIVFLREVENGYELFYSRGGGYPHGNRAFQG
jgi:hypothetical protein